MKTVLGRWKLGLLFCAPVLAGAGTFGTVVPIGGQSSDIALDSTRGVLYIADFAGQQIDVMSLATNTIQSSIPVAGPPSSIAVSPDGRYLLAVNFGNYAAPQSPSNSLTIVDLTAQNVQTFALGSSPIGVAFGADGKALIVTTTAFLLFDPVLGAAQQIATVSGVTAQTLPVTAGTPPTQITTASMSVSGDGLTIYGMAGASSTFTFRYAVNGHAVMPGGIVLATGTMQPRVVSVNQNGTSFIAGWAQVDTSGHITNRFAAAGNVAGVGSSAFDTARGLVYAQIPQTTGETPTLLVANAYNLSIEQSLQLPENLRGKSLLSPDGNTLYAVSDSGVLVMPVGELNQQPQVIATASDLLFVSQPCSRAVQTQYFSVVDPSGSNSNFQITGATNGVTVSPTSGITPATIQVSVDPARMGGQSGTVTAMLNLSSTAGENLPSPVRVLANNHEPDQRGMVVDVPGTLVDVVADPGRNRFYVLRQNTDEVLVFDGTSYAQIGSMPTYNVPAGMAITYDGRYLLVACARAQLVSVFDLQTLQTLDPIRLPGGYEAVSVAASATRILAVGHFYDGTTHILTLDVPSRTGTVLPSLGVFTNTVNSDTVVASSPNGANILVAGADGTVMLYDATQDTFVASRKDLASLSGAYAASDYHQYVAGNYLLNSSLVPATQLETGTGTSSGFAFAGQSGFRSTVPVLITTTGTGSGSTGTSGSGTGPATTVSTPSTAAGTMERVSIASGASVGPMVSSAHLAEAPLLGSISPVNLSGFTRTVAPLANQQAIVSLSVSGFTVVPWNFDAGVAQPVIASVVNAADGSPALAPGGLVSVYGQNLSPVNQGSSELPLSTAVGESCLLVNGFPMPVLFVSDTQINAQMPFEAIGDVTLVLHTAGGVSGNYNLQVLPGAPAVFRSGTAGPVTDIPTVVRISNGQLVTNANPIHPQDQLSIYLTGLGATLPSVATGQPAPSNPLALTIAPPLVTLGGVQLPVMYSGLAPGEIGVYQINVIVPRGVPAGMSIPLQISQAGDSTSLNVRVLN
jgi:uncharacterized protein (TIGR03437 family)